MGRIGNSLSHLMLAVSTSLQQAPAEPPLLGLSYASLQAFALITQELGRVMSFLVQTRRQVWLAQSPLTETCRRVLRSVPVKPGELFGSAALEALERAAQARQTRQQLSGLRRPVLPAGPGATLAATLSHWLTGVVCRGPSSPLNRPMTFVPQLAWLPGASCFRALPAPPRGLQGPGG
ncbi:hypothetical protein CgunFtcFv8_009578 [Champsocephalus gunnari]|uniref:Uncharacterized protein n=1 Tax=Champsocephalus gunnari TaxID=52237 RepID=A0AAN8C332_CHAGU|nr:hypothetical protein CgunFtcFv8_009578 [Champsocephalus gunnari]